MILHELVKKIFIIHFVADKNVIYESSVLRLFSEFHVLTYFPWKCAMNQKIKVWNKSPQSHLGINIESDNYAIFTLSTLYISSKFHKYAKIFYRSKLKIEQLGY